LATKEFVLSRVVNILFALALLILVVVVLDPNARQKATALVNSWEPTLEKWDNTLIVNAPSIHLSRQAATPPPAASPGASELLDNNDEKLIPVTGNDTDQAPIIQINWEAFKAAMQRFWNDLIQSLQNIKIKLDTDDNK
jgi:hypothetical protein